MMILSENNTTLTSMVLRASIDYTIKPSFVIVYSFFQVSNKVLSGSVLKLVIAATLAQVVKWLPRIHGKI